MSLSRVIDQARRDVEGHLLKRGEQITPLKVDRMAEAWAAYDVAHALKRFDERHYRARAGHDERNEAVVEVVLALREARAATATLAAALTRLHRIDHP